LIKINILYLEILINNKDHLFKKNQSKLSLILSINNFVFQKNIVYNRKNYKGYLENFKIFTLTLMDII